MQRFSAVLIAISLVLLSANVSGAETNVCNAGIGGTGVQQDGIGGTGNQSEGIGSTGVQASSGVGGTGTQANSGAGGTGIVGIITGFASICVNGLEVHYDAQTSVDIDGLPATVDALNIGQLVAIESSSKGNQLRAQRVSVSHILIGEIENLDVAQNTVQIMGQTINLSNKTIGGKGLKPNQIVKISGLATADNLVHALRIDLAATNTPSSIAGVIDQNGKINGVNITGNNQAIAGRIVQVSGRWDGSSLHVEQIIENAMQRVLKDAESVVIQGIAPSRTGQQFNMQNHTINIDANTKIKGGNSGSYQTIVVRGKLDRTGKITARTIEYSGEDKILERGGSKHRPNRSDKSKPTNSNKDRNVGEKMEGKDRTERPESAEKPEKTERLEKVERLEKTERPEKIERSEHTERVGRAERHEDD
jgi:hypothetical protein